MREKLIELLGADTCKHDCCEDCEYCANMEACIEYLKTSMADHLIANGVTIADDRPRFFVGRNQMGQEELAQIIGSGPVILSVDEGSIVPIHPGRWIPVTERLPEVDQRILVYCESKTIEKHVTACTYMGGLYGHQQFSRHVRRVTHWMPLPEPPKEV